MVSSKKARSKKSAAPVSRTRYQNFLRKTLRRKPCLYILFLNAFLLFFLVSALVVMIYAIIGLKEKLAEFKRDDAILKARGDQITFNHCLYENEPSSFNTEYCQNSFGYLAFAWREYKLKAENTDPSCVNLIETVNCHDNEVPNVYRKNEFKVCEGVNGQPLQTQPSEDAPGVIAPVMSNEKLRDYKGKNLLASQLIVRCPRCESATRLFRFKNDRAGICYRTLKTVKKGWPVDYESCDVYERKNVDINHVCNNKAVDVPNPFK